MEFASTSRNGLTAVFPAEPDTETRPDDYLWARTIRCPYCDGLIPLSPNWRLAPDGTGVRLRPDRRESAATSRSSEDAKRPQRGHRDRWRREVPLSGLRPNR